MLHRWCSKWSWYSRLRSKKHHMSRQGLHSNLVLNQGHESWGVVLWLEEKSYSRVYVNNEITPYLPINDPKKVIIIPFYMFILQLFFIFFVCLFLYFVFFWKRFIQIRIIYTDHKIWGESATNVVLASDIDKCLRPQVQNCGCGDPLTLHQSSPSLTTPQRHVR